MRAHELAEILTHLNGHAAAPDNRRAPRIKLQLAVELSLGDRNRPIQRLPSRITNISARGAQLLHPDPLTPGEHLVLHLAGRRGEVSILCSVTHCRTTSTQKHLIGVEFVARGTNEPTGSVDEQARRIRDSILR